MGIFFIVISLILGTITKATFIFYYHDSHLRWTSVIIYLLSWIPLIVGVWWVGHEYSEAVKKYFSYKFYHQAFKTQAGRALSKTRGLHQQVRERMRKK